MIVPLMLLAAFVGAFIGTGLLRRYALSRDVLDVPNERSSHSAPTPRGGGVAIVVAFTSATIVLVLVGAVDSSTAIATVGAGLIVAAVGFVDDHRHVSARWRLLAHFAAAVWALAWLGGLPPIVFLTATVNLGVTGDALAVVALVWLLNLYNFMDGIDGIAGVEAVTVCAGAAAIDYHVLHSGREATIPLVLAAASLGFLLWNLPPARIFLGDAGSGFMGMMLGVFAIRAGIESPRLLWSWLILLGVFVVDATVTLLRRLSRGERLYQAHRSHAYQHAARRFGGHRRVTIAVGIMNVAWLLPLATTVALGRMNGAVGVGLAYVPLLALATLLRAGKEER